MATHNLTYKYGNNFENEFSAGVVSVPALLQPEGGRGTIPATFIAAGDIVESYTIPANSVIKNFYLIVEEAMAGTVTVELSDGTDIFAALTSVTTVGIAKSALVDVFVTEPDSIKITFSDAQTAGSIKIAYDFVQLDTNTAKYIGE
jgi:hypothetical protein